MAAKILLSLLLLSVASELALACGKNLCPVVENHNRLCRGKLQHQCVCDFTCSEWDKPCNWVVSCEAEIENINIYRSKKNKLPVIRLPHKSHQECLEINVKTHNHTNCCNLFCSLNIRDVCF
ncbi:uncharacterized protein LOC108092351 [Drosophila ficusphila]|uniref:uncharacterized protein LOC108092351 n=1 Tax=Drosophila ficusphila TaxID=30025 RepID=UPI0007E8961D|nr:uncharacterized protein LOC108092351 [Drosophila ficusphila]